MRNCLLYLLIFWFSSLGAQEFALKDLSSSRNKMEWIKIGSAESIVNSFIVYPDSPTTAPAVIIIHEEFGVTEWMMSFADQVALQKYIAIVPDLLTGKSPGKGNSSGFRNLGEARDKLLSLDQQEIFASIDMALSYIDELPSCNGTILIAGLGWGGSQVFNYLSQNDNLEAGLVFYGMAPGKKKILAQISTPIYGFYGDYDNKVNQTLWGTDKKMKQLGKPFYPVVYEFGGHGFMRTGERPNANEGNIKARTAAWNRLHTLLEEYSKII
ncbi:MAG: dienelactone hydrolase family protein [Bacteroidales bacterium]|nr:dienelactone hydrolase family protein [Bacteroidales bacterium]